MSAKPIIPGKLYAVRYRKQTRYVHAVNGLDAMAKTLHLLPPLGGAAA